MIDSTAASIERANVEREQLHAEVDSLRAEVARLSKNGDTLFVEGYDQAVGEIRDHFRKAQQIEVVAEIEKIWMKGNRA